MMSCSEPEIGGFSKELYSSPEEALKHFQERVPNATWGNAAAANQAGSLSLDSYAKRHLGVKTSSGPNGEYAGTVFETECCEDTPEGPRRRPVYVTNNVAQKSYDGDDE